MQIFVLPYSTLITITLLHTLVKGIPSPSDFRLLGGGDGSSSLLERLSRPFHHQKPEIDPLDEIEEPPSLFERFLGPTPTESEWLEEEDDLEDDEDNGVGAVLVKRQGGVPVPTSQPQNENLTSTEGATPINSSVNQTINGPAPGFIPPEVNPDEDQVDCHDTATGPATKCWDELNLTSWVQDWLDSHYCHEHEGFSDCFLRQNGFQGMDCSGVKLDTCTVPQNQEVASKHPEQWYVAYTIFSVNQFFNSWYQAISNSAPTAQYNIGKIVEIIDIPEKTSVALQWVLIALQGIFAIVPGPLGVYAANSWKFNNQWQAISQVISNAVSVAPNAFRFIFPTGTADSKLVQLADLSHNFANVIMTVKSNINVTLSEVMGNSTAFLAFAQKGNFSGKPPSLPEQENYLYYGFNTYLISQALNGNNVYGVISPGTDVKALANNGSKLNYPIDCKDYDDYGICDAWWYSTNYRSSFTLDNFDHMNRNYGRNMYDLISNFTTGELLFEGAYACHSEGNFGQPVNITINAGGINTACISQLKILTWNMDCTSVTDKECEFVEAGQAQDTFFATSDLCPLAGGYCPHTYSVPAGYLGPLLTQDDFTLRRD
ncbi:MAG: hypothetical protein LQ342_006549 [Letrouitia transgressa]|nr:MAG: hypothetical protein LQ342_006549 [Letrouitia transgressa]